MRCQNLSKSYGNETVLDDVSLELSCDHVTLLQGYSGCGKTTLLRCLALLEDIDSGEIEKDGIQIFANQSVSKINRRMYHKNLSVVFQQLFLWPTLNCRENIEIVDSQFDTNMLVKQLNVEDLLDRYPNQVSVGQRQRVALIRALVKRPRVLLVDELTSSLDTHYTEIVCDILNNLQEQNQMKILAITHDERMLKCLNRTSLLRIEHGRITT